MIGSSTPLDISKKESTESTPSEESQEELWSAVEDIVEDKIGTYYPDLPTGQLTFNIVEALKEQFTMTRKLKAAIELQKDIWDDYI